VTTVDTDPAGEALVRSYLDRLRAAGWGLVPERRDELVAEVREHIDTALHVDRQAGNSVEVAARNVLERLGPPEEIVRAESEDTPYGSSPYPVAPPQPERYWGGLEIAAIVTLAAGSIILPVIGPLIGMVLAWVSPRWTTRQKVVATALSLLPQALLFAFILLRQP
jgi:hypothetical protein